jgi:hypothetical protein
MQMEGIPYHGLRLGAVQEKLDDISSVSDKPVAARDVRCIRICLAAS